MAIGPVQLIVLGFEHPDFHGEIIAELERLRESDTVRVIDALAVYKDADGEFEVEHLSNLSAGRGDRARQQGRRAHRPRHRGRGGLRGRRRGRRRGGRRRRPGLLRRGRLGRARGHPERLGRRARPDRAPLGGAAARRRHARRRLPHRRRLHQPARPRRDRPGHAPRRPSSCTPMRPPARPPRPDPTTHLIKETRDVRITQSRTTHRPPHRTPRLTTLIRRAKASIWRRRREPPRRGRVLTIPGLTNAPW